MSSRAAVTMLLSQAISSTTGNAICRQPSTYAHIVFQVVEMNVFFLLYMYKQQITYQQVAIPLSLIIKKSKYRGWVWVVYYIMCSVYVDIDGGGQCDASSKGIAYGSLYTSIPPRHLVRMVVILSW